MLTLSISCFISETFDLTPSNCPRESKHEPVARRLPGVLQADTQQGGRWAGRPDDQKICKQTSGQTS